MRGQKYWHIDDSQSSPPVHSTSDDVMPVTALLPRLKVRLAQLSNSFSMCSWMLVGSAVPSTLNNSSSEMKKNLQHTLRLCMHARVKPWLKIRPASRHAYSLLDVLDANHVRIVQHGMRWLQACTLVAFVTKCTRVCFGCSKNQLWKLTNLGKAQRLVSRYSDKLFWHVSSCSLSMRKLSRRPSTLHASKTLGFFAVSCMIFFQDLSMPSKRLASCTGHCTCSPLSICLYNHD